MEPVGAVSPRRRGLVLVGIVLVAGAAAGIAWWARAPAPSVDPSIAMLPLESHDLASDDAYLAPAIQDELLGLLARAGAMRVMSRNSTDGFARTTLSAPQIGRALGVSYLLRGSVERADDTLRVRLALRDAAEDRLVWESSFERGIQDVFAIESEAAQAIAEAIRGRRLTAAERVAVMQPPTANAAAYDAYLHARAHSERTARNEADILDAIAAYEQAVRLDPSFASAWAQLSRRHSSFYSLGYDRSEARREAARHALETAERLAPDSVDAQAARAYFLFVVQEDLEGADRAVRALETRYPMSADIAIGLAQITRELGQLDRSAEYSRRAIKLDPLNPYRQSQLCQDYLTSREIVLALHACERALELLPGDSGTRALQATIHQARGELTAARALLRGLEPDPGDWRTLRVMSRQLMLDRDPRGAVALLAKHLEAAAAALGTRRGVVRRWLADAWRQSGDPGAARAAYQASRAELEEEFGRQPANPLFVGELAIVRARLGDSAGALDFAQRCVGLAHASRRTGYIGDCGLARVQVALAANAAAELPALLDAALRQRGSLPPLTLGLIRLDPDFDAQRASVRTLTPD
jgi:TolB-like protein